MRNLAKDEERGDEDGSRHYADDDDALCVLSSGVCSRCVALHLSFALGLFRCGCGRTGLCGLWRGGHWRIRAESGLRLRLLTALVLFAHSESHLSAAKASMARI